MSRQIEYGEKELTGGVAISNSLREATYGEARASLNSNFLGAEKASPVAEKLNELNAAITSFDKELQLLEGALHLVLAANTEKKNIQGDVKDAPPTEIERILATLLSKQQNLCYFVTSLRERLRV